jgi:hypothetical protein
MWWSRNMSAISETKSALSGEGSKFQAQAKSRIEEGYVGAGVDEGSDRCALNGDLELEAVSMTEWSAVKQQQLLVPR